MGFAEFVRPGIGSPRLELFHCCGELRIAHLRVGARRGLLQCLAGRVPNLLARKQKLEGQVPASPISVFNVQPGPHRRRMHLPLRSLGGRGS